MKIKKEFTVRDLYGEDVLVPVGETAKSFKGIIKMNNIGRFIWENLEKVETEDEIVSMVVDKYALELTQAKNDVDDFIKYLKLKKKLRKKKEGNLWTNTLVTR